MSEEQQPLLSGGNNLNGDNYDAEANLITGEEESNSWRVELGEVLESKRIHKLVITLITIDAICVLADLTYTFLSPQCPPPEEENPAWLEILSHISLAITTLFLIEIPLALFAFGPQFYNPFGKTLHASFHVFDAVIIIVTFVLEAVLRGRERELAGLLILLRLWRLVKLVGGIAVGAGEIEEELSKRLAETEEELRLRTAELNETHSELEQLRTQLQTIQSGYSF